MNPKMPSQSKGNISYYCLYNCHSNGKNIDAKYWTTLKNEKYTQKAPQNTQNSTSRSAILPYSFVFWRPSECYQEYMYKIAWEFEQYSRDREKYPKNNTKWPPVEENMLREKLLLQ